MGSEVSPMVYPGTPYAAPTIRPCSSLSLHFLHPHIPPTCQMTSLLVMGQSDGLFYHPSWFQWYLSKPQPASTCALGTS